MNKVKVVNIKCGGCEKSIISSLEKLGIKKIKVDVASQTITFDGDEEKAVKKLNSMGYPLAESKEAKSLGKKAKSYVSCMIGRIK